MESVTTLSESPERITDISLLERASYSLQARQQTEGRQYVFEYTQQPMVGGTCKLVPRTNGPQSKATKILGTYDTQYFEAKLAEQRGLLPLFSE